MISSNSLNKMDHPKDNLSRSVQFLNARFSMTESPEVIDTTQGLLRIDYVEIDDRINRHGN